jgi:hypothetical protein
MWRILGIRPNSPIARHRSGRLAPRCNERMISEALMVPIFNACDSQHVVPVLADQFGLHLLARQAVETAVIGFRIDSPEARLPDVDQSRAELVPQQKE